MTRWKSLHGPGPSLDFHDIPHHKHTLLASCAAMASVLVSVWPCFYLRPGQRVLPVQRYQRTIWGWPLGSIFPCRSLHSCAPFLSLYYLPIYLGSHDRWCNPSMLVPTHWSESTHATMKPTRRKYGIVSRSERFSPRYWWIVSCATSKNVEPLHS